MAADDNNVFPLNPGLTDYDDYQELIQDHLEAQARMQQSLRSGGIRDTHFIHDVGKYTTPSSNSWEAYSNAVRTSGMHFDSENYIFDKAVGRTSGNRAIYDPAARHYPDYEPLRHNLAVLRNFVLNHIYGEEIDQKEAQDKQKYSYVVQIGKEIGEMLRRGTNPLFSNPFAARISPQDANVEYDGAVEIYKKLISAQKTNRLLAPLDYLMYIGSKNYVDQAWKLPPIELTPFGKLNFYAPPPTDSIAASDPLLASDALLRDEMVRKEMANTLAMDALGTSFTHSLGFNSVESLAQPIKIQAIEIAREILEKLKIQFQGTPIMAMMDYTSGQFQRTMTDLNTIVSVYQDHLQRAATLDPSLTEDPMVLHANEAVGYLGAQIKLRALDRAEMTGDYEHAEIIRHELVELPQEWLNPNLFTSSRALAALEQGLQMVLATLTLIQEEGLDQNQRGLMMQASFDAPEEQHRRMQSLSFDEEFQKIVADRRSAFAQLGGTQGKSPTSSRQGSSLMDSDVSSKKHGRGDISASAASKGSSVFDGLLSNYGANSQQMQSSLNAPTSGNFTVGAPNSPQQTIQQVIAHRNKSGLRGKSAQRKEQQKQDQQRNKEMVVKHKHATAQRIEKLNDKAEAEENERDDAPAFPPPRRPRETQGR